MKPRSRKISRILFLLLVLALLATGAILAGFESWRAGRVAEVYSNSDVIKTSVGDVEFARRGEGPALLVLHDAAGGYDQGLALAGFLEQEGFEVISMSRPGYLRTPLTSGLLPENQADAAAALLESLSIPRASLIAFGWGAPAALQFALRHPERLSSLILAAPVLSNLQPTAELVPFPQAVATALTGDVGAWLYHKESEEKPISALTQAYALTAEGSAADSTAWADFVTSDPVQLENFRDLVLTLSPLSARETGIRNDILQIRTLPALPLEKISAPTLVIHGGIDKAVPLASVEAASAKIAGSEFQLVPDAGHLLFLGRGGPAASARIASFLRENSTPSAEPQ
jgi:pimeloyl-ACP methyl ester carboxylesterase